MASLQTHGGMRPGPFGLWGSAALHNGFLWVVNLLIYFMPCLMNRLLSHDKGLNDIKQLHIQSIKIHAEFRSEVIIFRTERRRGLLLHGSYKTSKKSIQREFVIIRC